MRPLTIFAAAAALAASAAVAAAPPTAADRAALDAVASASDVAWNVRDARALSRHYAEDGSLRLSNMPAARTGRDAIQAYFEQSFAQRAGTLRHVTSLDGIEMLTPNLALTDARVEVQQQQPDGSWKLVRAFRNASLAERDGGGWKIRAVRAYPIPAS